METDVRAGRCARPNVIFISPVGPPGQMEPWGGGRWEGGGGRCAVAALTRQAVRGEDAEAEGEHGEGVDEVHAEVQHALQSHHHQTQLGNTTSAPRHTQPAHPVTHNQRTPSHTTSAPRHTQPGHPVTHNQRTPSHTTNAPHQHRLLHRAPTAV